MEEREREGEREIKRRTYTGVTVYLVDRGQEDRILDFNPGFFTQRPKVR